VTPSSPGQVSGPLSGSLSGPLPGPRSSPLGPAEGATPPTALQPPFDPVRPPDAVGPYRLRVNDHEHVIDQAWLGESLLHVLRERLGLCAAKQGCASGECGACSVLVDRSLVSSCLVLATAAAGRDIRTVEGMDAALGEVREALMACGAAQCGLCLPGLTVAVHDLLDRNPDPDEHQLRAALSGNLCRCTGYGRVLAAVRMVAQGRNAASRAGERAEDGGQDR
jgi:aerobic-type carbon monoxide dehydrogenase small subunit (CoxS/CutS family)